jgi:DHA1 family tetracycline resistance protein-like MFS transporter
MPVIAVNLKVTGLWLGLLTASYSIAQFIAAPILGSLSDQYGRKPVLLISKFGSIIAYLILAFSNSYWLILLSRLVDGFTGGNISAARAYITDITTPKNRAKGMAMIGISFGFGLIIGPAVGGVFYGISSNIGAPALFGAFLCALSFVLTYLFLQESHIVKPSSFSLHFPKITLNPSSLLSNRIVLIQLVYMVCVSGFQTTFALFTANLLSFSVSDNSTLFIYMGLLTLTVQGLIVKKSSQRSNLLAGIGLVFAALGLVVLSFIHQLDLLLIALAITLTGVSLVNVYLPVILVNRKGDETEGKLMGLYEGYNSLARIIGPALAGSLIFSHPRTLYFSFSLVLLALVALIPRRPNFSLSHLKSNHAQTD